MRLTEVFKNILNKFIHRNPKKEPEGIQIATEPIAEPEEVQKTVQSDYDRQQKLIRRYRAYAFHHKKKRLRKKYMKKLLEASPIDNYFFLIRKGGGAIEFMAKECEQLDENNRGRVYAEEGFAAWNDRKP